MSDLAVISAKGVKDVKEVVTMWKSTKMIILVALSAAIYGVALIVFKGGIVIIPGVTEIRPGNVFPVIFGIMFGPAGAWGSALGNLIGDFFGTLGPGSIGGFVGNFFLGLVSYKMWGALLPKKDAQIQNVNSWLRLGVYVLTALTAAVSCGVIIGWWLDLIGLVPYAALANIISVNNFAAELVLGPWLLLLLYPPIKRWGLIWTDIMAPEDVAATPTFRLGGILMLVGALGGLIIGDIIALGLAGQQLFAFAGASKAISVDVVVLLFIALQFVAAFMMAGREQFGAEEEEELAPATAK